MSSNEKMKYIEEGSGDGLPGKNTETFTKVCRDEDGKTKAQLELKLLRDGKGNKNCFYKYIGSKRKAKENVGPLW